MMSLKLFAYNTIKQKIISCEYPPNSLLNEEILKNDLHVSRTPIRDALGRLEQIYEIRLLIEPYVLGKYGCTVNPEVYGEFKRFFSRSVQRLSTEMVNNLTKSPMLLSSVQG
jgi:DNA-binding GntR family transcriptional regulator